MAHPGPASTQLGAAPAEGSSAHQRSCHLGATAAQAERRLAQSRGVFPGMGKSPSPRKRLGHTPGRSVLKFPWALGAGVYHNLLPHLRRLPHLQREQHWGQGSLLVGAILGIVGCSVAFLTSTH